MPGGDGTGPRGTGPIRGRGRGRGGYGHGWGRGRGRGQGWGRHGWGWNQGQGRGRGQGRGGAYTDNVRNLTPQQEAAMLREQAKAMQEEIKKINARISQLENLRGGV